MPTDSTDYSSGATVTVAGNTGSLAKTGYTFGGWCTTQPAAGAACAGTSQAAASTFAISSNTTLYAVWTANTLNVTTDEQSGDTFADTTTTTGASMNSPGTPTRTGYTFAGWSTTSGGSAITFPYTHNQTGDFTLYALWTVTTYSVTYNGNTNGSGSVPTDSTAYSSGATVTVAGNTGSLAKTGYTFGGWCTTQPAAGAACAGTSQAAASTFAISSNTTLYAVWTANTLNVTTDEQSGDTFADTTTTTGASMNSPGTPTRTGYTFAGWSTTSG
ncbi:MAG: InlB B-repeat-containing protein, partial [Ilumatobacteraceae bacterium]